MIHIWWDIYYYILIKSKSIFEFDREEGGGKVAGAG